jgi:hypothetical protein
LNERQLIETWVSGLTESDFKDSVLIPLFRAMGYNDVMNYHGGVRELGKDIVMWEKR